MSRGLFRYDVTACETKVCFSASEPFIKLGRAKQERVDVSSTCKIFLLEPFFLNCVVWNVTQLLPGKHGFIAQLNEGRHLKKRATEFRVDQVLQEFDAKKFNFTKVATDEVLFRFEEDGNGERGYIQQAEVLDSPNVIAINVRCVS